VPASRREVCSNHGAEVGNAVLVGVGQLVYAVFGR
jgi:hypothetical protein